MRRYGTLCAVGSVVLGLSGCGSTPPATTDLVRVHKIIDSLKCGTAAAILASTDRTGIRGAKTTIDLQLNVVTDATSSLDLQTTPAIALYTGASIAPYLKGSYNRKYTMNTQTKFSMQMETIDTSICSGDAGDMEDVDIGFGRWILGIMKEIEAAKVGSPEIRVTEYTYDASFGVIRKSTAGMKLTIVPIVADAGQAAERDDVQHLEIVITPLDATARTASRTGGASSEEKRGSAPFAKTISKTAPLSDRARRVLNAIAPATY